ncbi:Protein SQS1 [Fusarium sp. LHS14.1]|nr:Protein SQS1 [Fusarium sp. LHS14.1]
MPRNKKGASTPRGAKNARGGRGGRGGRGASRGRGNYSPAPARVNFIREETTAGFTLADEARQTSQHDPSRWNNLRMRPVKFVSAGPTEPLKLLDALLDEENDEAEKPTTTASPEISTQRDMQVDTQDESDNEIDNHGERGGHEADVEEDSDEDDHFIGPDELEKAIQAQVEPDNETLEEPSFFFDLKGDQSQPKVQQGSVEIPERPSSRSSSSSEEVILFKGRAAPRKPPQTEEINMAQMQTEIRVVEQTIITESAPAPAPPSPAPELSVEPQNRKKLSKEKQREKRNARRELQEEEDAILADYIANMKENSDDEYFRQLIDGGSESDDAEEDASDSHAAISKQQRASSKKKAPETSDSDEDQEEDLSEEEGKEEEDEMPSEIDDETLARLIAGQDLSQDLGMDDVNFGDSSSDSDSSSDKKAKKRYPGVDDEVDLMDWERPSLRRRKGKGAKAQITFNLSDSELEAQLQAAWKTDRQKKSERKKRREELRALGMLGKTNPDDLRVKYPDGMNMDQVAEELRAFLVSSDEQLTLPPMDNNARKMIHELANKFKIKSKSTGKGDQRRPTLYRTGRTLPYVAVTFDQAINRVNRRYFPRLDMKGKKSNRLPPVRGGASVAAATYQDGEIVGGSAPELGVENRGRAMLEKMGWSSGTALGAMNNKGILQPVTHAMKRSKAGLG